MKNKLIKKDQVELFEKDGYLVIKELLTQEEIITYRNLYEDFLSNKIDVSDYRSDLGSHTSEDSKKTNTERITQIMVPSRKAPQLLVQSLHTKSEMIAQQLLGTDMILDFDMLIDKAPHSDTPTPWHQDRAYWITMPDTRAVSCWVALDDTIKENGCMWYVPGSHLLPTRTHRSAGKGGGALECDAEEIEGKAMEISAGDCVFHHGGTLHYSRGNTTNLRRRAFITNFRPRAMVEFERSKGYDHTGDRKVQDDQAK